MLHILFLLKTIFLNFNYDILIKMHHVHIAASTGGVNLIFNHFIYCQVVG